MTGNYSFDKDLLKLELKIAIAEEEKNYYLSYIEKLKILIKEKNEIIAESNYQKKLLVKNNHKCNFGKVPIGHLDNDKNILIYMCETCGALKQVNKKKTARRR